jgi:hypothetical protein
LMRCRWTSLIWSDRCWCCCFVSDDDADGKLNLNCWSDLSLCACGLGWKCLGFWLYLCCNLSVVGLVALGCERDWSVHILSRTRSHVKHCCCLFLLWTTSQFVFFLFSIW